MNKIKIVIGLLVFSLFIGCSKDDDTVNLDSINTPKNISAVMTIKQDNSGLVTIVPNGEGVTQYEIYFGDATTTPALVNPGASAQHTYAEGNYQVRIVGTTLDGKSSETTQDLTVSFVAPENLEVTINSVPGNNLGISVSATADYETFFEVYFGEDPNQVPVVFMEGETVTFNYATVGTYTVRVVALSGGVATTEYTEDVTITNPVLLPIDFESATLNYDFVGFGGANTVKVANPNIDANNGSANVARLTKNNGSEV